ncbi:B12-binding domain-containing radical SAM protein [Chloroflexota bacterium]
MDILLIDPPHGSLKNVPSDHGYNLGLTSLAAYIRREGIETAVVTGDLLMEPPSTSALAIFMREFKITVKDLAKGQQQIEDAIDNKNHDVWMRLTDIIKQTEPMAVGIAYFTPFRSIVERTVSLVKEIDSDIKIIAGSYHPSFCPEEVIQNPDIDFVVKGEGEIPLLALVKELKKDSPKLETVPGIYYKDAEGQIHSNPGIELIENLDELPFPARDLVLNCDYDIYMTHHMTSTRGCPYSCAFCAEKKLWGGRIRRRSIDNLIEELKLLKDNYNINVVNFVDGTFTYDREYLQRFCNEVIDNNLNIEWGCTARYDNLDKEILRLMKRSGCYGLYLGLESGSNRMLKAMGKKETVEEITKASEIIYNSGITSITSILLGLPYEEKEDVEQTLRLLKNFKTDFLDVNTYTPLAGTAMYDAMSEEEKKSIDWRKIAYKSFNNYFSDNLSRDEFQEYQAEAYRIADRLRKKSMLRLASKNLLRSLKRVFRRTENESDSSTPFTYA